MSLGQLSSAERVKMLPDLLCIHTSPISDYQWTQPTHPHFIDPLPQLLLDSLRPVLCGLYSLDATQGFTQAYARLVRRGLQKREKRRLATQSPPYCTNNRGFCFSQLCLQGLLFSPLCLEYAATRERPFESHFIGKVAKRYHVKY